MTRTKIERVGGHLLIDDSAIAIAQMGIEWCYDHPNADAYLEIEDNNFRFAVHGWTAREVLEVAYGPQVDTEKTIADLRATVEVQREEIAVLREALRRVLEHYFTEARNGDGIDESAWTDVAAAMTLAKADGPRFDEPAIEYGLASIREAAKVER